MKKEIFFYTKIYPKSCAVTSKACILSQPVNDIAVAKFFFTFGFKKKKGGGELTNKFKANPSCISI